MSGSHLCIPRNEIVLSKTELYCSVSQFLHSYIWERFIHFQDRSAYSAAGKYVDRSWEYTNRSQTHECGNQDWSRAIPRKGIHKWDFHCSVHYHRPIIVRVYTSCTHHHHPVFYTPPSSHYCIHTIVTLLYRPPSSHYCIDHHRPLTHHRPLLYTHHVPLLLYTPSSTIVYTPRPTIVIHGHHNHQHPTIIYATNVPLLFTQPSSQCCIYHHRPTIVMYTSLSSLYCAYTPNTILWQKMLSRELLSTQAAGMQHLYSTGRHHSYHAWRASSIFTV